MLHFVFNKLNKDSVFIAPIIFPSSEFFFLMCTVNASCILPPNLFNMAIYLITFYTVVILKMIFNVPLKWSWDLHTQWSISVRDLNVTIGRHVHWKLYGYFLLEEGRYVMKNIMYLGRLWDKECKWNLLRYSRCSFEMSLFIPKCVRGMPCHFGSFHLRFFFAYGGD